MNSNKKNSEQESRRAFLAKAALATAAVAVSGPAAFATQPSLSITHTKQSKMSSNLIEDLKLPKNFGIGGVAAGNAWHVNSNQQIEMAMAAAWEVLDILILRHFMASA
jgi:D-threo-aldose 1-dehydrogenase